MKKLADAFRNYIHRQFNKYTSHIYCTDDGHEASATNFIK